MQKLSRRRFLEDSIAALGATVIPAAAWASNPHPYGRPVTTGAANTLRIAVLGLHGRGRDHISGYAAMPDVEVVAVCDPDTNMFKGALNILQKAGRTAPQTFQDLRRVMDDHTIDAVSIATPNNWHALAAIWAMQAGKDVYVEKPVSHEVAEGRRMVQFARKYNRICEAGTQSRASSGLKEAMAFLHEGHLGKISLARGLCYKRRESIGIFPDSEVPSGVDYNLWTGPAKLMPFNKNRFHYNWHWNWTYGNGDIGNQGIHEMDKARWGLNQSGLPKSVVGLGGRFGYEDAGETPNTLVSIMDYGDSHLIFEVRGLETPALKPVPGGIGSAIGDIFYGTEGVMVMPSYTSAKAYDNSGNLIKSFDGGGNHFRNFIDVCRTRKREQLNADIEEGHISSALCHLANISYRLGTLEPFNTTKQQFGDYKEAYATFGQFEDHLAANGITLQNSQYRLGRHLEIDPHRETFKHDTEADAMLTRTYREPFVVPARA